MNFTISYEFIVAFLTVCFNLYAFYYTVRLGKITTFKWMWGVISLGFLINVVLRIANATYIAFYPPDSYELYRMLLGVFSSFLIAVGIRLLFSSTQKVLRGGRNGD